MKKILFFFLFGPLFLASQTVVDPHTFPQETNPNNSNFEFYSRALGSNKRATFNNVRKNMAPGIVAIGFTPSPSGNTSNFGDFVLDPSDALWYIAYSGDAVQLPYNTPFSAGTGISISGGNVISNTGDLSSTNELQTISIVGQNLTLSNGGGTVTIPAGATYTAGTGITILSNVVTNTGDLSSTNEGLLSLSPGTDSTAIINSNTSGSPSITFLVRGGLSIDETGNTIILEGGAGTGVSSVTGTDGNGFDITVVNPTTAPEISIATTVTGITYGALGELDAVTVGYGLDFTAPTLRVDTSEVATPYDLSLIDKDFVNTSDATSHTVTLTPGGGSLKLAEGSNITLTTSGTGSDGIVTIASTASGTGTVTDFVFTDGNGFNGTVSTSTSTPTLELETTVTGLIYGGSGDLLPVTIGSGLSFSAPTLSAVDVSATNEAQTLSVSGTSTGIVSLNAISGTGGGTATFEAAGINSISQLGGTITITGTEVDGALANEGLLGVGAGSGTSSVLLSNTTGATGVTINASTGLSIAESTSSNGGSITLTNSAPDQTVSLTEGGIVDITGTYPNFTISATEVDGLTTNEGVLGVAAGGASSAQLTSNTSGASNVTINVSGIISVTETTASNGGSITLTGTEVDGSTTNELQTLYTDDRTSSDWTIGVTPAGNTLTLDAFTSSLSGLTPGSGGGTTNFLRADGTWAAPPGGGSISEPDGQVVVGTGSGADSYPELKYMTTPNDLQLLNTSGANNANFSVRTTDTTGTVTIGESSENSSKYRLYAEGNGPGIMHIEKDARNTVTSSITDFYMNRTFYPSASASGDNQVFNFGWNYSGGGSHVSRYQNAIGQGWEQNYINGALPGISGHGIYEPHIIEVIYSDTVQNDAGTKFATGVSNNTKRRVISGSFSNESPSMGGQLQLTSDKFDFYDYKLAGLRTTLQTGYISGQNKGLTFTDTAGIYFQKNNLGGIYQRNAANSLDLGLIRVDASDRLNIGFNSINKLATIATQFDFNSGMVFQPASGNNVDFGSSGTNMGALTFYASLFAMKNSSNTAGYQHVFSGGYEIQDASTGVVLFGAQNDQTYTGIRFRNPGYCRIGGFPDFDKIFHIGQSAYGATSKMFYFENASGGSTIYRYGATPEAAITANRGDAAFTDDGTDGALYIKKTGTGNTGWAKVFLESYYRVFEGTRTLPAIGNTVNIGTVTAAASGGTMAELRVVVDNGDGNAQAKMYEIPSVYNGTSNTWENLLPLSSNGVYAGSEDFKIEIKGNTNSFDLRIRTVGGTALGTVYFTLKIAPFISGNHTFTPSTTVTTSPTAVTATYRRNAISQVENKLGVNTLTPTEAVDITGNVRFSGALMPNNTAGSSGQVLTSAGAGAPPTWQTPASSSGTVTSVGLSLPGIFSVSGSPVTTSGTLTGTLATQTANTVFAGPTTGGAATPTFRALVTADLPATGIYGGSGTVPADVLATVTDSITFAGTDNVGGNALFNITATGSEPEILKLKGNTGHVMIGQGDNEYYMSGVGKPLGMVSDEFVYLQGDSIQMQAVGSSTRFEGVLGVASNNTVKQIEGTVAGQDLQWNGSQWQAGETSISPSDISGSNQNDYNPTGLSTADIIYLSSDADMYAITGMQTGGANREVTYINDGDYPLVFSAENTASTAANRFAGKTDFLCYPGKSITWIYDATASRWRAKGYAGEIDYSYPTMMHRQFRAGSITAGDWGDFSYHASGTAAGQGANAGSSASQYSYIALTTGTTSTGVSGVTYSKSSQPYYGLGTYRKSSAQILISGLSDATNRFTFFFREGTALSPTTLANNTFGIRYSDNINSGKFECFTRNTSGTETTLDSGVTVAANTIYNLETICNKQMNEIKYYINGVFIGSITTNTPTTASSYVPNVSFVKSAGTTPAQGFWMKGHSLYMY